MPRWMLLGLLATSAVACRARAPQPPSQPDEALRQELLRRGAADQELRKELVAAFQTGKQPDSALIRRIRKVDSANGVWLRQLLATRGWPTRRLVGVDGASAAFLLVQHADADTALQAAALTRMEAAYRAGEASGQHVALLTDRVAGARGQPQVYGTQADFRNGRVTLEPLRDSANVDKRRAALGLPPLHAYLRVLDSVYGVRPPGR